jgi:hypothetical protein
MARLKMESVSYGGMIREDDIKIRFALGDQVQINYHAVLSAYCLSFWRRYYGIFRQADIPNHVCARMMILGSRAKTDSTEHEGAEQSRSLWQIIYWIQ